MAAGKTLRRKDCHAVITTYGMAARTSALADLHFPAIILDEAQAIKTQAPPVPAPFVPCMGNDA